MSQDAQDPRVGSTDSTPPTTPTENPQAPPSAAPVADDGLLSLQKLRDRYPSRTKRVHIDALGADVVVQKLPARILEDNNLAETSPMVLALTYGVAEPEITEEIIQAMTFEEASAIFDAVEEFNPGILGGEAVSEEEFGKRRSAFPS